MAGHATTDDDRLDRVPTDQDLNRLQWTTVLYYLHETNPDNGLVRDKTDPAAPCSIAAVGFAVSSTSPRARGRTPPGTRGSSTTSSTSKPAAASGTASCPPSTRRSCSPACSPAPPISTPTRPTRPKSAAWPTPSTAGPT